MRKGERMYYNFICIKVKENTAKKTETKEEIMEKLKKNLEKAKLPKFLEKYASLNAKRFGQSALNALAIKDRVHFVKESTNISRGDKSFTTSRVMPVDHENTGMIESDTQWDGGLQQFVQMIHGVPTSPLSVSSAYTTIRVFLKRYKEWITGLTGTIGSQTERNYMEESFLVQTTVVPRHKKSLFKRHPDILCKTDDNWLEEICSKVRFRKVSLN